MSSFEKFDLQPGFSKEEFENFLAHAYKSGVSDITLASGGIPLFHLHGSKLPATTRAIQDNEMRQLATVLYRGENALSLVGGGKALDFRYDFRLDRERQLGFRVNIHQGRHAGNSKALIATLRALPDLPRHLRDLKRPAGLTENMFSEQGLVIVAGVTGSGKSTLLAGAIRHILEDHRDTKIQTFESPIEYVYDKVQKHESNFIEQIEIGIDLKTFADGVRAGMRCAPDILLVGEMRDAETIKAGIEAVLTGHKTYSTVHAETPGIIISRMVQTFPYEEHSSMIEKLVSSTRLLIVQRLIRTIDGKGRVAVNSWVVLDSDLRRKLSTVRPEEISRSIDDIAYEQGTTMAHHAAYYVRQGLISVEAAAMATGTLHSKMEEMVLNGDDKTFMSKEELNG